MPGARRGGRGGRGRGRRGRGRGLSGPVEDDDREAEARVDSGGGGHDLRKALELSKAEADAQINENEELQRALRESLASAAASAVSSPPIEEPETTANPALSNESLRNDASMEDLTASSEEEEGENAPAPDNEVTIASNVSQATNDSVEKTGNTLTDLDYTECTLSDAEDESYQDDENDVSSYSPSSTGINNGLGGRNGSGGAARNAAAGGGGQKSLLNNDEVGKRMRHMFEKSLALHATGEHMQACQAITTQLYPHQMFALAWMAKRENQEDFALKGGILADDMGLGKTLTVLSLIMTNFHDRRPLARVLHGYKRRYTRAVLRYLPSSNRGSGLTKEEEKSLATVGTKAKKRNGIDILSMFKDKDDDENGISSSTSRTFKKDAFQKVKSSKRKFYKTHVEEALDQIDESLLSDESDEFDKLAGEAAGGGGLKSKLGMGANSELWREPKKQKHFDALSDDEEYQNMTEAERNKAMLPSSLNVDGATEMSEEDEPTSSGNKPKKDGRKRKFSTSSEEDELPELDDISERKPQKLSPEKEKPKPNYRAIPELNPEQKKNLIIPQRQPAICGSRRRATLIITPSSLIGHWLQQIEQHIDSRVDLRVFVHHGQSKAVVSSELQDQDIVFTTYGTMMAEFNAEIHSPLLHTKWLRVCLDEGHAIKNFRAKTSKAISNLDTQRKWIISGTPIQNNLGELWSLLVFLNFEPYASDRKLFKHHIEDPIKHGHPRGLERLQTLVEAVCLRRTKSDEVDGKPLVSLPTKTVKLKELKFSNEEQIIYDAYLKKGKEVIMKFMKKGTLLRNYAHIFAVMLRLRQLCCHRELLPVHWKSVDINELIQIAAEEAAKAVADPMEESDADPNEMQKRLAEQLRNMIKEGISDDCSICLSDFDHPVITPCGHVYCRKCITQYVEATTEKKANCPLCRGEVKTDQLLEAAVDEEEDEETDPFDDIIINVSSAKINAVLKELEGTKRDFPGEKTIIVSQFTSLLSIIQPLLTEREYTWTRLDGTMNTRERSRVIGDFQDPSPDSPSVLLLSLRAGGVGLNLIAASRMILLDPAWNPSTEEQCFDRIHRLGQTKDVVVTKFVMAESIELRMLKIQEKKKDLINGAFRQTEHERRQQRIQDIRDIFGI